MPCVIVLLVLGLPRAAVFFAWLFHYFDGVFAYNIVPFVGFLFAPLTTLAWAWSKHTFEGVHGLGLAVVIVAALFDLGLLGSMRRRPHA